jgi:hypothetical protein
MYNQLGTKGIAEFIFPFVCWVRRFQLNNSIPRSIIYVLQLQGVSRELRKSIGLLHRPGSIPGTF